MAHSSHQWILAFTKMTESLAVTNLHLSRMLRAADLYARPGQGRRAYQNQCHAKRSRELPHGPGRSTSKRRGCGCHPSSENGEGRFPPAAPHIDRALIELAQTMLTEPNHKNEERRPRQGGAQHRSARSTHRRQSDHNSPDDTPVVRARPNPSTPGVQIMSALSERLTGVPPRIRDEGCPPVPYNILRRMAVDGAFPAFHVNTI